MHPTVDPLGGDMREHAVLWGRDHVGLGEVAVRPVGRRVALAISRGLLPKPYDHVDPNEDTVAAVAGGRGTLLVVADGHNGFEAPEAAVRTVLERLGGEPPAADLSDDQLVDLFHDASRAVLRATWGLSYPRRESRTTLTIGLVAGRRLQWAGMGDSALLVVGGGGGRELSRPDQHFVGWAASRDEVERRLWRGSLELPQDAWTLLVSDGFTNFVGAPPEKEAAELLRRASSPVRLARALIDHAGAGGAGDNVAVAVAAPAAGPRHG